MTLLLGTFLIIALVSLLIWVLLLRSLSSATPYVPISKKIFPFLDKGFETLDGQTFYDLGCGDGKVVAYVALKYPNAQCHGIEKSLVPYVMAKFRVRNLPNASIRRGDFMIEDLNSATRVYLYLFPVLMPKLEVKLKQELQMGSIVLSCDFKFPGLVPVQQIQTGRPAGLGGTIFKYIW